MNAKPFIKWVGGKRKIIKHLLVNIPSQINNYYEPFIGGGALFFEIANSVKHSYLSDINKNLITAYQAIKIKILELIENLKTHKKNHCKDYYYEIRNIQNIENEVESAARLIYLIATCFNGLYRVNKKDIFNTPIGNYQNPNIFDENNLFLVHQVLQNTTIAHQDFLKINPQKNDFVYFAPPYHNSFSEYTSHKFIKDLYKNDFKIIEITTSKSINPSHRKPSAELLIINYDTKTSNSI